MKETMFSVFDGMVHSTKPKLLERKKISLSGFIGFRHPKKNTLNFAIEKSEITNQTILVVKDFAEKKEIKDQSQLWDYQVKELFHRLGSN